jgi:Tfp pilus tip-associated adhesin PilY1
LPDDFTTITDEDNGSNSDLLPITINSSENGIAVNNPLPTGGIFKSDKKGWYLNFGSEGEKVLANSITNHGKVLFTSVVPDIYAQSTSGVNCSLPETQGRAYVLDILKGTSVVDLSENGGTPDSNDLYTVVSANEIPGNVQIIFNKPSATNGGACTAENCVQDVDLRVGKKRSQITSYNSGILESVYWSQSQGE